MTTRREVIALYRAGAAFAHAARIRATASLVSTGRKTRLTSVAACGRWNEKELASAAADLVFERDRRAGLGAELRLVHPQEHGRSRA